MRHPNAADARARAVVRHLPTGQTGRVVFVPLPRPTAGKYGSAGTKARIALASGSYRSVAWRDLVVVEEDAP